MNTRALVLFLVVLGAMVACGGAGGGGSGSGLNTPVCPTPPPARSSRGGESAPSQLVQSTHSSQIDSLAFSPSGRYLASVGGKDVRIWDVRNGQVVRSIQREGMNAATVQWQDEQRIVVFNFEQVPELYDLTTNRRVLFGNPLRKIFAFPFSSASGPRWIGVRGGVRYSEKLEVIAIDGGGVEIGPLSRWNAEVGSLEPIAASDDGRTIAARTPGPQGGGTEAVYLFQLDANGKTARRSKVSNVPFLIEPRVASGKDLLAGGELDYGTSGHAEAAVIFTPTESRRRKLGAAFADTSLAMSLDGSLGVARADAELVAMNLPTGETRWSRTISQELWASGAGAGQAGDSFRAVAIDAAAQYVAVGTSGGKVLLYDAKRGYARGELGARVDHVTENVLLGGTALIARTSTRITAWSLSQGRMIDEWPVANATGLGLSPDGREVLVLRSVQGRRGCAGIGVAARIDRINGDGKLSAGSFKCLPSAIAIDTHLVGDRVAILEKGPRGHRLAIADPIHSRAATVPLDGGEVAVSTYPERPAIRSLGVIGSNDGAWITMQAAELARGAGGRASGIALWNGRTGTFVRDLATPYRNVVFSPSGRHLAVSQLGITYKTNRIDRIAIPEGTIEHVDVPTLASQEIAFLAEDKILVQTDFGIVTLENLKIASQIDLPTKTPFRFDARAIDLTRGFAIVEERGSNHVWDLRRLTPRATLTRFDDGEWLISTPSGHYTGTTEVGDRVGWLFESPLEHFGAEHFREAFRDERAVARALGSSEALAPPAKLSRPPSLDIVRPPSAERVSASGTASVTVSASSSGGRVEIVRAYIEGRPVDAKPVCASKGEATFAVPLVGGTNHVSFVAFDDRGAASNQATLEMEAPAAAAKRARPSVWVVAVGVSRYPHLLDRVTSLAPDVRARELERMQLPAAANDARGVAETFASLAGEGRFYSKAHVTALVDDDRAKSPVTAEAVRHALGELEKMAPDDTAVVHLAGHGFKPNARSDMSFALGSAELRADGAGLHAESSKRDVIGWSDLGDALSRARGRVLVLLDACHSGHVRQEDLVPNDALASALVKDGRAGALVFAAAKGRQLSLEPMAARGLELDVSEAARAAVGPDETHGFFTGALLASLRDPATDRDGDGTIQISELIAEVTRRVTLASNGQQTPWVARRDQFGDFAITKAAPKR